jgi:hypothetical protein
MNEERSGKCLRQVEHIRGHLWPQIFYNGQSSHDGPTLPGHLSSSPVFSRVRVTRSIVLCVCFVDRCLSFCTFSFGHYAVCSSSIYGFWLPLWFLFVSQMWVRISIRARCTSTLCDKVYQWLATGRWISPDTTVSSTNKTDHHGIAKILLKAVLNTITHSTYQYIFHCAFDTLWDSYCNCTVLYP